MKIKEISLLPNTNGIADSSLKREPLGMFNKLSVYTRGSKLKASSMNRNINKTERKV